MVVRTVAAGSAVLLAVLLAGCGSDANQPVPSPSDTAAANQRYLAEVASLYPNPTPDADRIKYGRESVCGGLDKGLTVEQSIMATASGGFGEVDGATLVRAAIAAFCPDKA